MSVCPMAFMAAYTASIWA
uniref:Uncharacterized protein n=1 Tax=Arundo donax TaxID=35708 RepID=A0A0A9BAZ6_ARUDO